MTFISQPAYISANQAVRSEEGDPLDQRYASDILADRLLVLNEDFYFDMDGFRYFNLHLGMADAAGDTYTIAINATNRNDGTAPGSIAAVDWYDVGTSWFGAATFTATDTVSYMLERDTPVGVKYVWIEVTAIANTPVAALLLKRFW